MRFDLFEFVEGLIRGVVYFLYNVIETSWQILRHPVRGPIRLYRDYVREGTRQIGGLTFLLLAFMLFYWPLGVDLNHGLTLPEPVRPLGADPSQPLTFSEMLTAASASVPKFDVETLWPVILASLTSTVLIDAVLRLLLRWLLPNRRAWRHLLLAAAEYALLWMVCASALAVFLVIISIAPIVFGSQFWLIFVLIPAIGMGLCFAARPAAVILGQATRPRAALRMRTSRGKAALWTFGLLGLFALAVYSGANLGLNVQERRAIQEGRSERPVLVVETLSCSNAPDGRLEVEGFLHQQDTDPRPFSADNFSLWFVGLNGEFNASSPSRGLELEWARPDASRYIVLTKEQPQLVHLRTVEPAEIPRDMKCRLQVSGTKSG